MIIVNQEKCSGCGLCEKDCFPKHLTVVGSLAVTTENHCLECGHCLAICPNQAITMTNYDMNDVESIKPFQGQQMSADLLRFMKYRRSIRQFQNKPVEKEKLQMILEAGQYSPTGSNSQTNSYLIVQERLPEIKALAVDALADMVKSASPNLAQYSSSLERITAAYYQSGTDLLLHNAPVLLIIIGQEVNASLAASRMELMANALGLGACYIGYFARAAAQNQKLRDALGLNTDQKVITTLIFGYPAVEFKRTVPRKPTQVRWL